MQMSRSKGRMYHNTTPLSAGTHAFGFYVLLHACLIYCLVRGKKKERVETVLRDEQAPLCRVPQMKNIRKPEIE